MTILFIIVLAAAFLVYAALLAAKFSDFPADECRIAIDTKPVAPVSPLNGPQNRESGVSLRFLGADERCGENLLTASDADGLTTKGFIQGGLTQAHRSPIRPTLNRRAHRLGRWLAISPTIINFPVRDSHWGSSEKRRRSSYR